MIRSINPRMSLVAVTLAGLCSLVVSGCSDYTSEARRVRTSDRQQRRSQGSAVANFQPASPADVLLAQGVIRKHLHALGSSKFNEALNLLTPDFRKTMGDEAQFGSGISNHYSDFMHVKKVIWRTFSKDESSGLIIIDLFIEAKGGNITQVNYMLQPEDGQYLIARLQPNQIGRRNEEQGSSTSPRSQLEERIFSGVLFSPTPRHRVLDSPAASL